MHFGLPRLWTDTQNSSLTSSMKGRGLTIRDVRCCFALGFRHESGSPKGLTLKRKGGCYE